MKFDGFLFFSISLVILVLVQRILQKEIQIILLLLTKKPNLAIGIFSLLLLPGVFIHEVSHLLMALILRVPVRKLSLIPQVSKKGKIRLGFVETAKSDILRDSLIGLAPFVVGLILIGFIGMTKFRFDNFINIHDGQTIMLYLNNISEAPDIGLWFYFAFAISTTMLPSEADRQSWKFILIVIVTIMGLVLITGFGDWMALNVFPFLNRWLLSISLILLISILIHLSILFPALITRQIISKLTGLTVK